MSAASYRDATAPHVLQRWHGLLADGAEPGTKVETAYDEISDAIDHATGGTPGVDIREAREGAPVVLTPDVTTHVRELESVRAAAVHAGQIAISDRLEMVIAGLRVGYPAPPPVESARTGPGMTEAEDRTTHTTFHARPATGGGDHVPMLMSTERINDATALATVVDTIARTIEGDLERAGSSTEESLAAGPHAWGKKIIEEAGELWLAIEHEDDDAVALEASHLLYRLLVGVMGRGVTVSDVLAKL